MGSKRSPGSPSNPGLTGELACGVAPISASRSGSSPTNPIPDRRHCSFRSRAAASTTCSTMVVLSPLSPVSIGRSGATARWTFRSPQNSSTAAMVMCHSRKRTIGAGVDVSFFNDWVTHAERNGYWQNVDGENRAARLRAPALLMAGWFDPFLPSQLDDFLRIRAETIPEVARETRLIIGPWGHAEALTLPDGYKPRNYRLDSLAPTLPWFDRHLKGNTTEPALPPIRLFVIGENIWRDEQEWPLARSRFTSYFLDGRDGASGFDDRGTYRIRRANLRLRSDRPRPDPGGSDARATLGNARARSARSCRCSLLRKRAARIRPGNYGSRTSHRLRSDDSQQYGFHGESSRHLPRWACVQFRKGSCDGPTHPTSAARESPSRSRSPCGQRAYSLLEVIASVSTFRAATTRALTSTRTREATSLRKRHRSLPRKRSFGERKRRRGIVLPIVPR